MKILLGPILGAVTRESAKVWIFWNRDPDNEISPQCRVFKDRSCTEEVSRSEFKTVSRSVHEVDGIHGIASLAEISFPSEGGEFYFKITFDPKGRSENNQVHSIRPFPKIGLTVDSFSFGLISCHHPWFRPDKDKKIVATMWRHLGDEMQKHDCRFLIQAGDQVYADHDQFNAWERSLKTASQQEKLSYYRQTYLKSWDFPNVQDVMRAFPQYMIWDDHEITNGWGSDERHSEDPTCRQVFEVARQAYVEFQHSHNPDPLRQGEFYFAFNYGTVAFLFLDLRGHRDFTRYNSEMPGNGYPLAGKMQWEDIKAWLESEIVQESKMLFVVTSVPTFHLSRKWGSLGRFKNDVRDQWSTSHNKGERRLLLDLLYQWSGPKKRPVFILGGDVHVGTIGEATEIETGKKIHQITSSPITNKPAWFLDLFLALFSKKFKFHLEEGDKRPVHGKITKRFRRRNFAVVKVEFTQQNPRVYLHMYTVRGKRVRCRLTQYDFGDKTPSMNSC